MLCEKCKSRGTCTKLCAKAEKYAGRHHIKKRETTLSESNIYSIEGIAETEMFEISASIYTEEITSFQFLTPLENKIASMFYLQRKTHKEIARALSGNRARVRLNQKGVEYRLSKIRGKILGFCSNGEVSGYPRAKLLECLQNRT